MPFVLSKQGVYYRPVKLITTHKGVSKDIEALFVCKGGRYQVVWEYADTQRMLILSSEIPSYDYSVDGTTPSKYTTFEFPQSGIWRVAVIGDGARGGDGGGKWAGYSGGQGGGGGTGGCIVLRVNIPDGVTHYLKLSRFESTVNSPYRAANTINCQFMNYDNEVSSLGFFITPGDIGGTGETAAAFTPNPDGGAGGQGGKVYWYKHPGSTAFTELTDCIGFNGGNGAKGYGAGPPMNTATGHAGEAPPQINEYSVLASSHQKLGTITNVYQRPDDYYTAIDYDRPNAIQGYTLEHLALGNAGIGGWKTVVDGDLGPGQGALGGVVIEKLSE